ncbi:MAG: hypothetical protein ACPGRU_02610, partial [Candidatus Puniceispirillaceae bacterium]
SQAWPLPDLQIATSCLTWISPLFSRTRLGYHGRVKFGQQVLPILNQIASFNSHLAAYVAGFYLFSTDSELYQSRTYRQMTRQSQTYHVTDAVVTGRIARQSFI